MSIGQTRIALELAGRDPSPYLIWSGQRPVRVVIDGPWVKWDYLYTDGPIGPGEPEAGFGFPQLPVAPPVVEGRLALAEFLSLVDASPDGVRRFVARWGPLHLCRHHLPATHWPLPVETAPRDGPWCADVDGDATHGQELIDTIRAWARIGRATLRIGLDLSEDSASPGNPEDWRVLGTVIPEDWGDANRRLESHLNVWLALGLVWVQVSMLDSPRLHQTAAGSFGVVGRELVSAVMNASTAICVACGDTYQPSRRPRSGEDTYCAKRGCKDAARAAASRRSRRRQQRIRST